MKNRLLRPFAVTLLSHDFPSLPPDRAETTTDFVLRRIATMPSPMRLGVTLIALALRLPMTALGASRTVAAIASTSLPLLGEYVRLHRSLAYAYIWESWPETSPDGAAR